MYFSQPPFHQSQPNVYFRQNDPAFIQVTGESTLSAPPDQAIITLGMITENKNLHDAQTENVAVISNVIKSLLTLGIPKEKIETLQYQIESEHDYPNGQQTFRAFKVTHQLNVIVDNVNMAGPVVDTAVQHGANSVSSIQFTLKDPDYYYSRALMRAIENGSQKAQTIAQKIGVSLHRPPTKVVELHEASQPIVPFGVSLLAKAEATPIQPRAILVKAAVRMDYFY
ncbi:SIMPL domain-containing protein [bacterium LRH843]|nr:SIMPL domain-containing protein [bacterium LRH843]